MKKQWLWMSLVMILCGCQTVKQEAADQNNDANVVSDLHEIQALSMIGGSGAGNEQGYYYISNLHNNNHNDYTNIMYIDYTSKKEMYLCNKPNCNHDEETCPSYLAGGLMGDNQLYIDDEHIYVIYPKEQKQAQTDEELSFSTHVEVQYQIYQMDLDGSNRKISGSLEKNEQLQSTCYAQGKYFYAVVEQTQTDQRVKKQLIRIDGESGKRETLRTMDDARIIGAYQQKLVLVQSEYYAHFFDANASVEEMRNLLNASQAELLLYDCSNHQETSIIEKPLYELNEAIIAGDDVYYQDAQGSTLRKIYLQDGTDDICYTQLQQATVWKLDETHLKLEYFDDKEINAGLQRADLLHLETGEITPLKFTIQAPYTYVDVLAETKDFFLVINDYDAVNEYIAYFDVTQTSIQDESLALIPKADYYAQLANYQVIDRGARR